MPASLVTVPELSLWAEGDSTAIDPADPLAVWILQQASILVMEEAGVLNWTSENAPGKAKIVVANVGKRCWNNRDQELRTAIAGGPSSQVTEAAAYGMMLTPEEITMIAGIDVVKAAASDASGLWTLPTTRGPLEVPMYVPDNRWPQSSPINYLTPARSPYYFPTSDEPLPPTNVPDEPTNTVL